jgi:hypothetical protein
VLSDETWARRKDDALKDGSRVVRREETAGGGVTLVVSRELPAGVPGFLERSCRRDGRVTQTDVWGPAEGGTRSGTWLVEIPGAPAKLGGTMRLEPTPAGSRFVVDGSVEVKVPLVGGKAEGFIAGMVTKLAAKEAEVLRSAADRRGARLSPAAAAGDRMRVMPRPRVLSGIRPTGQSFQLGNYVGAVRHWAAMQDENECYFFLADLHALTETPEPAHLRTRTRESVAELLAMGVDPARSAVFAQSHLSQHAELGWVLGCLTGFGEASRMTQFKEKGGGTSGCSPTPSCRPPTSSCTRPTPSRSARTSASTSSSPATSRSASTPGTARPSRCRLRTRARPVSGSRTCRTRTAR